MEKMAEIKEKGVHLDQILKQFGIFHRYQIKMILLIGFAFFMNGMHCVNYILVAEKVNYRCKISKCETGSFQAPWYNLSAPVQYRNCYKYGNTNHSECSELGFRADIIEPCDDWLYKDENSFVGVEAVHSDHRLELQILFSVIFGVGGVIMAVVAYYIPYWRHLVLALYVPSILFVFYCFVMDESVRWLLSKGRKKKAKKILIKMAQSHGIEIDTKELDNIQCEESETNSSPLRDTFRSKIVVRRFLVCLVWWISCTFVCFGLMVNVVSLAGDKYVNFGLMSLSEIPASFAMVYTLKKFKRKRPLIISFFGAGLLCFIQPLIPKKYVVMSTGLYFVGKFVTTFTFATVYMYTSELFPTYTRNSMHALCSAIGRIGSIVAPMTPLLMQYSESLPTLLIGAISIVAGLATLLVPDLSDEPLPDNVKQAEVMGTKHNQLKCNQENNRVL